MSESLRMGGELSVPTGRNLRLVPAVELVHIATDDYSIDVLTTEEEQVLINLVDSEDAFSPYGDQFDWAEAEAAGLHLVGSGSHVHSSNSGHHSSYLSGQLRAGNDINSLD